MALATWRWRWVPSLKDTPRHGAGDRGGGAFEPAASVRAGAAAVATAPAPAPSPAAVGSVVGRGRGGGGRQRAAGGAAVRQREAAADARVGDPTVPAHRQPDRGRVAARRLPLSISRL